MNESIQKKLIEQINPILFSEYLNTAWTVFHTKRKDVNIFQYLIKDKFYQVTIPLDTTLSDYDTVMYEALNTVACVEGKSVEELVSVLTELSPKTIYGQLTDLIVQKKTIEEQLKSLRKQISEIAGTITPDTLKNLSYDEIKAIWDDIKYEVKPKSSFDAIINEKKIEKYPELRKAVYYPEINVLPISEEEKIRLDRAANKNYRSHISRYNINRLPAPLSIEDLEMLKDIGVVEKKFMFLCPECGCSATTVTEEELKKYKRTWELNRIEKERKLPEAELDELDKLYEEGYFEIYVSCMDCDDGYEVIESREELDKYMEEQKCTPIYCVKKQPESKWKKI